MSRNYQTHPSEGRIVCFILGIYAALSFISLRWFQVFFDDPGYADPAASLLMGQGFTSGAWYAQGYEGFWAGNVPLHQFCLYLWMKLFGFGLVSSHSINIAFVVIGIGLLWLGIKRLGILITTKSRLAAVILILCSHPGGVWVNLGRTDAICVALAGWMLYSFSLENKATRFVTIFVAAAAAPWAGVPLALTIGFAGGVLLVFYRGRFLGEVACMAAGGFCGVLSLAALYQSQGVLDAFLQSLAPHSSLIKKSSAIVPPPVGGLKHRLGAYTDYTLLCLVMASGFGCLASLRNPNARPWLVLGFLGMIGIPVLLAGAGVFPLYYAWFSFIPGLISLIALIDRNCIRQKWLKRAVFASLGCVVLLGFPRVWTMGFLYRADDIHGRTERFLANSLHPDDVVLTEPQGWYAAKANAKRVYHGLRAPNLSPAEADSITVVVSSPRFFQAQQAILTGDWIDTPDRLSLPNRNTHRLPFSKFHRERPTLELHVFRRATSSK